MKKFFETFIIISTLFFCAGMRKIDGNFCEKAFNLDMLKIQKYDTLEKFSEYFNFEENCWTSDYINSEENFQMNIPLRDNDVNIYLEFRYGRIEKLECSIKNIKLPCNTIDNPNIKLNKNLQILNIYNDRSR